MIRVSDCSVLHEVQDWYVGKLRVTTCKYFLHKFNETKNENALKITTNLSGDVHFYRGAVFAVMQCLSVRLSVRPSVTFVDHVKTNKNIFFHHLVATPF